MKSGRLQKKGKDARKVYNTVAKIFERISAHAHTFSLAVYACVYNTCLYPFSIATDLGCYV